MLIEYNKIPNYRYFSDKSRFFYEIGVPQGWQDPVTVGKNIVTRGPGSLVVLVFYNLTKALTAEVLLNQILKEKPEYKERVTYNEIGTWRDNIPVQQISKEYYKDNKLRRLHYVAMNYDNRLLYLMFSEFAVNPLSNIFEIEQETLRVMGTFNIDTAALFSAYGGSRPVTDTGLYLVNVYVMGAKQGETYIVEIYGPNGEYLDTGRVTGTIVVPYPWVFSIPSIKIPLHSTYKVCVRKLIGSYKDCDPQTRFSPHDTVMMSAPY